MKLIRLISIVAIVVVVFSVKSNGFSLLGMQPPERVRFTLDSLYPGTKEVHWSKKRRHYTADFIYSGLNFSIAIDRSGSVVKTVEEIAFEQLPEKIKEKVNRFYKSYKIVMVSQQKSRNKSEYDVEVIQGSKHYILNYHEKGFLIHQYEVHKYDSALDIL